MVKSRTVVQCNYSNNYFVCENVNAVFCLPFCLRNNYFVRENVNAVFCLPFCLRTCVVATTTVY